MASDMYILMFIKVVYLIIKKMNKTVLIIKDESS